MRKLYRQWWVALLLLSGCASLGLQPARSFDTKLAYVQAGITTARTSAANAVLSGQLSSADGQKALGLTDQAETALKAAKSAETGADMTTAAQKLQTATTVLTALQSYLVSKGVKTNGG